MPSYLLVWVRFGTVIQESQKNRRKKTVLHKPKRFVSQLFRQNECVTSPKLSPLFRQGAQCQEPNPHTSVLAQAEPVPSPLARSLSITSAWVIQSM